MAPQSGVGVRREARTARWKRTMRAKALGPIPTTSSKARRSCRSLTPSSCASASTRGSSVARVSVRTARRTTCADAGSNTAPERNRPASAASTCWTRPATSGVSQRASRSSAPSRPHSMSSETTRSLSSDMGTPKKG